MELINRAGLLNSLHKIKEIAGGGKFGRWWYAPVKYTIGQLWSKGIYPVTGRVWETNTKLFFGDEIKVTLPAGLDLFLLEAKTHDSEIRLARFFIRHIKPGDVIFDVGAHLGYFTLLASHLTGKSGKVISWEASPTMFGHLQKNTGNKQNIEVKNQAIAARQGVLPFFEFPMLYSEYNSIHADQYEKKPWFSHSKPKEVSIEANTLDVFIATASRVPAFIKIDVEGAEAEVIKGGASLLENHKPVVIMEFIENTSPEKRKSPHEDAVDILVQNGYVLHQITPEGLAREISRVPNDLKGIASDNLVFIHPANPLSSCC